MDNVGFQYPVILNPFQFTIFIDFKNSIIYRIPFISFLSFFISWNSTIIWNYQTVFINIFFI